MTPPHNTSPKPLQTYLDALAHGIVEVRNARPDLLVAGACDDSRQVVPGSLFVARPGEHTDGFTHVPEAWRRGACAVVSERAPAAPLPDGCVWIRVTDAMEAARLAAEICYDRPADHLSFAAVTGTNGKTTTAFLLAHILEHAGLRPGLISTVCCRGPGFEAPAARTTPFPFQFQALLRRLLDAGTDVVVLEASSHGLVQGRLGSMTCRTAGFTNLTGDHLDYHHTMDAYYEAKRLLFTRHLNAGGAACINIDDPYGLRLASDLPDGITPVTFGESQDAAWRIDVLQANLEGVVFDIRMRNTHHPLRMHTPLIGRFQAWNCTLAAAMAAHLGAPPSPETIVEAVRRFRGAPGRMELIRSNSGRLALVDYAHTDDALARALASLRDIAENSRIIAVFGCGGDRDRTKRPRMGRVAAARADHIILTSDNPRSEDPHAIIQDIIEGIPPGTSLQIELDRRAAIRKALAIARPGDLVLIAGKGHERVQIFAGREEPFDDRIEVRNALIELGDLPPDPAARSEDKESATGTECRRAGI